MFNSTACSQLCQPWVSSEYLLLVLLLIPGIAGLAFAECSAEITRSKGDI
jgi:hypothetical protein